MNRFKIIALTHKNAELKEIGKLHINDAQFDSILTAVKQELEFDELMYLSTCNRVEFLISSENAIDNTLVLQLFKMVNVDLTTEELQFLATSSELREGDAALKHLFEVASSIDSLVVGEREIITQVRNAYEKSNQAKLTSDLIRLVIKHTIETAKNVYTNTEIARKPVSVVSLAYRKLKESTVKLDARFLIIGAGQTNILMSKFLKKHGFKNFTIFNRSIENAEKLAAELNGNAFKLSELKNHQQGFDVILTCTAAAEHIITADIYQALIGNDLNKKIIIDLSVPNDLDPMVAANHNIQLIDVSYLQSVANENLQERKKELESCNAIIEESVELFHKDLRARKVELAMSAVPQKVKEIRETAMNSVFAKDLEGLDINSKEVLDKILNYVEKKYISVPMKMAKEILVEA